MVPQTVVVEKPVQQTVVVEKTVAPTKKTVVTVAYNGYFGKRPSARPLRRLDALKRRGCQEVPRHRGQLNLMPYEGGAWHDSYLTWFQAEDPTIDLFGVARYWLPEFAEQGWLLPLNDVVDKKIVDQPDAGDGGGFHFNGKLMALGPWWGGIGGLYYRKDLLEKAGIQPPKTYDELVAAAKQIMKANPGMSRLDLAGPQGPGAGQPLAWNF